MQKIFALIFSVFYLAFSSGIALKVHHCMGEVSFSQKNSDECGKCGKKESNDCCKTELKIVKIDKFQKSDFIHFDLKKITDLPQTIQFVFQENSSFFVDENLPEKNNSPPFSGKNSIFILHCNFRI